jgi:hypothetical protein
MRSVVSSVLYEMGMTGVGAVVKDGNGAEVDVVAGVEVDVGVKDEIGVEVDVGVEAKVEVGVGVTVGVVTDGGVAREEGGCEGEPIITETEPSRLISSQ